MEIKVNLGVSESTGFTTFDLEDLGITQLEWDLLSEEEKKDIIEEGVFDLPSQPYWMVDSFEVK